MKSIVALLCTIHLLMALNLPNFDWFNGSTDFSADTIYIVEDDLVVGKTIYQSKAGLPDTVSHFIWGSTDVGQDTTKYFHIYNYSPEENYYTIDVAIRPSFGTTLTSYVKQKFTYDAEGLPLIDSSWFMGTLETVMLYEKDAKGRIVKATLKQKSHNIERPDSMNWFYSGDKLDSVVQYNDNPVNLNYKSKSTPQYSNNKIDRVTVEDFNQSNEPVTSYEHLYARKPTSIAHRRIPTHLSVTINTEGGIVRKGNFSKSAQMEIVNPQGQVISRFSSDAKSIPSWDELSNGFYVLRTIPETAGKAVTKPFLKR